MRLEYFITQKSICQAIFILFKLGYYSRYYCTAVAAGSKCKFCKGCFTGEYPIDPPARKHINKYDQPLTLEMKNKVKK